MQNIQEEDPYIIRSLRGSKESITALAFHPGCRYVASAGMDNLILLWDLYNQGANHKFVGHKVQESFKLVINTWISLPP